MKIPSQSNFESAVKKSFGFLINIHGFSFQAHPAEGTIVFTNEALFITLFREYLSYMIYVKVTRRDTGEEYLLHEIIHAIVPEEESRSQCSGTDDNKMEQCLSQLGELCQRHLHGLFAMDAETLNMISNSARKEHQKYTLEAEYGAFKDRANAAWEKKEWEEARELYQKASPVLSVGEQRRLTFLMNKKD